MFVRRPADIGFANDGYDLPARNIAQSVVAGAPIAGDSLFSEFHAAGISGRLRARRGSLDERVALALRLADTDQPCIVWCGLNEEQDRIASELGDACASVQGSDSERAKRESIAEFLDDRRRVLVTKPRIAGFGINLQHCSDMIFVGLGDSYEQYYQAIRRC